MKAATALLIATAVASASAKQFSAKNLLHPREKYESAFFEHAVKYNLDFKTGSDFAERLTAFSVNSDLIETHNAGDSSFTLGHNEFSHLSFAEFEAQYLMTPAPRKEGSRFINAFEGVKNADSVDWSTTDAVTPVKDQGACGSCWSFSTTGAMEGAYFITKGSAVSFSEQQLVSCDTGLFADHGCNGGLMDNAFQWIGTNGICSEADYPYTSGGGGKSACDSSCSIVAGTKGITYTDVANSEEALASAVNQQPVSIAVDADVNWQLYSGGVFTQTDDTDLDHGVLLVGYGEDATDGKYWKVKNSWSASWGEAGYIRIQKDIKQRDGPCGMTNSASYPTLA